MSKFSGSCQCGKASYKADGEIAMQGNCHCTDCRKLTGASYATFVFMNVADVEVSGTTTSFDHTADSGSVLTKQFCPTCGSHLFSSHEKRPGSMGIFAGTINESDLIKPQFNVFTISKLKCTHLDPALPAFEKLPAGR